MKSKMKRIEFESDAVDRDGGDGEKFIHLAPVGEYLEFVAANIRKTAKNLTKAAANIEDALPFLGHFIDENERALRNIEKLKGLQELIFELSERVEKLEKATQSQQS